MKKCSDCKVVKSFGDFYKNRSTWDGLHQICKECKRVRNRVASMSEKAQASARLRQLRYKKSLKGRSVRRRRESAAASRLKKAEYKSQNIEKIRAVKAVWKRRHPEKIRAHHLVQRAIRRGVLVRGICTGCGDVKAQAHHEDYSKPLDVIWLCDRCHKNLHNQKRDQNILSQNRLMA